MFTEFQMSLHRWQKVASYLSASVIDWASLHGCVDHEEVWRGALVIREKKVGTLDCCDRKSGTLVSLSEKLCEWLDYEYKY